MHSHHDKTRGWQPFWAALGAALLVLLPLVGGTILLTRQSLRTKLAAKPQSGVAVRMPKTENQLTLLVCTAGEQPGLRAALPQRQPELHPAGGAACGDCHPLWAGRGHAGPVLCRGRPSPLPGSLIGASGSARDHPLSRSLPQCPGRHRGPVPGCCGWAFPARSPPTSWPSAAFPAGCRLSRAREAQSLFSGWDKDGTLPPSHRAAARAAVWDAFFRQDLELLPTTLPAPSGPQLGAADRPDGAGFIDTGKHAGVSGQRQCRRFRRRAARARGTPPAAFTG